MKKQAEQVRGRGRKAVDTTKLAELNEASIALGKQQQAAKLAPAKRGRPQKLVAEDATGIGKQQQATGSTPARATRKPAGEKQVQSGAAETGVVEKQGASASGKTGEANGSVAGEMRGGAKQVLITEATLTGRGGRPAGIEEYPFAELTAARKETDGRIVGPSFFIPMNDRAEGRLAAARKRHKALFWSRKVTEAVNGKGAKVEGLRIWRGTPELSNQV